MGLSCLVVGYKSPSSSGRIRHHVQHHGVRGGHESTWPEGSAEAAQLLHHVGVAIVNVQVVIATEGVSLQVEDPEG